MELETAGTGMVPKEYALEGQIVFTSNPAEIVRALNQAATIIEALGDKQAGAAGEAGETKTIRDTVDMELDLEQQHYISDAELEALTATFTELASSAGRVAASLTKINALMEETHADLYATRQAFIPANLPPNEERH